MNKKIVIFGCGKLGHEAIDVLGSENIECFCDNNPELAGTEKYGRPVISFDELKKEHSDAVIMICANIRYGNADAMVKQCEEHGVRDYFLYQFLRETEMFPDQIKLLTFLSDPVNRQMLKSELYIRKAEKLQQQVDYLKRHIDIRHIKPAGGSLREWQLMLVKAASELLSKLSELEIKPFLYGGSLLGYVRHNGFIPWDDDMDFALMRGEYEALKEYCKLYMYTKEEFYGQVGSDKNVREELKGYYWGNGGGDEFNIIQPLSDGSRIILDFFVFDYYAQDYSFEDLMKMKEEIRFKLNDAIADKGKAGGALYDDAKRIKCLQEALKANSVNLVEKSDHIYSGIDNVEIMNKYHRGGWISPNVIFPLRRVLYEGEYFYVPNDAEEFLKYEYENIWELPNDIGITPHIRNNCMKLTDMENW